MSVEIKHKTTGDVVYTVNSSTLVNVDLRNADLRGANPRGYFFHAVYTTEWRVRAGCRDFSITEAREHWGSEYKGPEQIKMFMPAALNWLEAQEPKE